MGLYARLSRRPDRRLLGSLLGGVPQLLEPLGERLRVERVGVYLGVPVSTGEKGQSLVEEVEAEGLRGLREALAAAKRLLEEAEWGDVFIRIDLLVEGEEAWVPSFPAYLLVTNAYEHHLEFESLEWIHGEMVVESLEESLEAVGIGVDKGYELLSRVGLLRDRGAPIAAATLGPPDALEDIARAAARWLTGYEAVPRAFLDTIDHRAKARADTLSQTAYDYLYPYRRDVLVDILYAGGALRDYLYTLQEEGILRIQEGRGLTLIEPQPFKTLNHFYTTMLQDVVIPYAQKVIQRRYQEFKAESLKVLTAIYKTRT